MNKRRRFKQKQRRAKRGALSTWAWAQSLHASKRAELKAQWHALAFGGYGPQQDAAVQRLLKLRHIYPGAKRGWGEPSYVSLDREAAFAPNWRQQAENAQRMYHDLLPKLPEWAGLCDLKTHSLDIETTAKAMKSPQAMAYGWPTRKGLENGKNSRKTGPDGGAG